MFLILYFLVLSTAEESVNRFTVGSKGLITTAIISTYLQLVHVHLMSLQNYMPHAPSRLSCFHAFVL